MTQEEHIIITPPGQASGLRGLPFTAAHPCCKVEREGRLTGRNAGGLRGGFLVLRTENWDGVRRADALCREISRACVSHGFCGVMLSSSSRSAPLLEEILGEHRLRLLVPERCAGLVKTAGVYLSSAISGGCLEDRLQGSLDRFGPDRLTLLLEQSAEDFFLPAPTGCGRPLTPEALQGLKDRWNPCIFFSSPLCARYFTYMSRDSGAHFVLFDDGDTMARKLERARRAGVRSFLLPSPAVAAGLPLTAAGDRGKIGPS